MGGAILLAIILFLITQVIFIFFEKRHPFFSKSLMNYLFWYHILFWLVYYIYTTNNWSDSIGYFHTPQQADFNWMESYGTSTTFMHFISYPFSNFLGFNFEMSMLFFSWIGFLGFLFTYLFFRENIPVKVKVFGKFDLLILLLFLPNMHFWTSAISKGAVIFPGIMMFVYALKSPKRRWIILLLGSLLTYHVRPHIFLFLVVGAGLGFMSGNSKISLGQKFGAFIVMIVLLFIIQDQVLSIVNMEGSENIVADFQEFTSSRAEGLSAGAASGVDMSQYPLPLQLFTFWFRPLFFDAPSALGLIVSVENLFYLILTLKIIRTDFVSFIRKAPSLVKMSFVIFFMTSFAMTFVMSNLGIIMRQKSMVMYFLFFVIFYYLAQKKYNRIMALRRKKEATLRNKGAVGITL